LAYVERKTKRVPASLCGLIQNMSAVGCTITGRVRNVQHLLIHYINYGFTYHILHPNIHPGSLFHFLHNSNTLAIYGH